MQKGPGMIRALIGRVPSKASLGVAPAILLWRMWTVSVELLWRDWLVVASIHALLLALAPRASALPTITASVIAYLLGIYIYGQLPYALAALGLSP